MFYKRQASAKHSYIFLPTFRTWIAHAVDFLKQNDNVYSPSTVHLQLIKYIICELLIAKINNCYLLFLGMSKKSPLPLEQSGQREKVCYCRK
jgi:hypothetical protein